MQILAEKNASLTIKQSHQFEGAMSPIYSITLNSQKLLFELMDLLKGWFSFCGHYIPL